MGSRGCQPADGTELASPLDPSSCLDSSCCASLSTTPTSSLLLTGASDCHGPRPAALQARGAPVARERRKRVALWAVMHEPRACPTGRHLPPAGTAQLGAGGAPCPALPCPAPRRHRAGRHCLPLSARPGVAGRSISHLNERTALPSANLTAAPREQRRTARLCRTREGPPRSAPRSRSAAPARPP